MFNWFWKLFPIKKPKPAAELDMSQWGMGDPSVTIKDGGPNFPMGVDAQDHGMGELKWKKTSWVAPEGVKTWAGDSCPKCGAKVNTNGGHGPWCPDPLCKWGWETEMDSSPLIHPNLKVWSEPKE